MKQQLWVWVCGPFAAGAAGGSQRQANLLALNEAALAVYKKGHVPLVGVNNALPLSLLAGDDPESYAIRRPLSAAIMERCDVCLRIGGASVGADNEVAWFVARNKDVYFSTEAIPQVDP
jgi:hypothetical protein